MNTAMGALVENQRVLVCCGPGGVGKTTIAGALALEGARRGRRVVVVTVDPARRLADALGLDGVSSDTAHRLDGPWPGELWVAMLDARVTFDSLVRRYAPDPDRAEAILANRFYRNLAGALSGTQEYMAVEKLFELHDSGQFDLIVVDTPPTRNALDFLDAPQRLARFLDSRAYRMFTLPARTSLRALGLATGALLRGVSRVVGADVISDASDFFQAFEGMEDGFRRRSQQARKLLESPECSFVVVTSPRPDTAAGAQFLADRLKSAGTRGTTSDTSGRATIKALVVNRVHPRFGPWSAPAYAERARELDDTRLGEAAAALAADLKVLDDDTEMIAALAESMSPSTTVVVHELDEDVCDLAGIGRIADALTDS